MCLRMTPNRPTSLALGLVTLLAACSDSSDNNPPAPGNATAYQADLYRTEGGVPHVVAEDWGSLGFGTGYADGEDNVCITARNVLKVRSQLSEHFGAGDGNRQKSQP